MISPVRARWSQVDAGRKRAAVCSSPPSWVGIGMTDSDRMGAVSSDLDVGGGVAVDVGSDVVVVVVVLAGAPDKGSR